MTKAYPKNQLTRTDSPMQNRMHILSIDTIISFVPKAAAGTEILNVCFGESAAM